MTTTPYRRHPSRGWCWLTSTLATIACAADGDGELAPEDKTPFACELGVVDEDGEFVPGGADVRAELDLGFQGFLFVVTHVRASGEVPQVVEVTLSAAVDGGTPTGATIADLEMSGESQGKVLSDDLLVFFNSSTPAELAMRPLELVVRLESPTHICTVSAEFLMVDDDPCIHTGDDPICPETDETDTNDGTDSASN